MTEVFCARTARRIQRLGYAKKKAAWLSKVCYCFMLFLRGLMGPIAVPSVQVDPERRHGMRVLRARAARIPLSFAIQRRLPA